MEKGKKFTVYNKIYTISKVFNWYLYCPYFGFGTYNALIVKSYTVTEKGIELSFPLKDGTYYVGQGGNQVLMNYHQAYPGQKYALDILKLNTLGTRASGLYPEQLDKYQIFADDLYSPCNGKVVNVQNDLPDLTPPKSNSENPEGIMSFFRVRTMMLLFY